MGMLFNTFMADGEFDRITKVGILSKMSKIKVRTSKLDINRIEKLVDLIGTRYINFKH